MSEETKETSAPSVGGGRRSGRNSGPAIGAKPKNMKKSLGRLVKGLFANKVKTTVMVIFLIAAAGSSALGPKALGMATNILFNGVISQQITERAPEMIAKQMETQGIPAAAIPAAVDKAMSSLTKDQIVDAMRAADQGQIADMIGGMDITIGGSVDFVKFGQVLLLVVLIYLGSLLFRWVAGWISVRLISDLGLKLRQQIEEKLWKLPLSYYDKTSRGEIMSRTTNDLDNLTQTLNQTGGDLIFMVLMVLSVIVMMFVTSPILAVIALISVPLSILIIGLIMKKSQPQFKKQWAVTGELNGNIEESFTGHSIIKAFGQTEKYEADFKEVNERLYDASFKAQFISGMIMPVMTFITNLNYVIVALVGALRVASGNMTLGDVQAFIQYSRQYSQPMGQISQMMNMLQSGAASAERIYEILDAEEESSEEGLTDEKFQTQGLVEFDNVSFSYDPNVPLIEGMNLRAEPGQTIAIVGPTGAGKTTLVNLIMRFYELNSGRVLLDGVDIREMSRSALRRNVGMVLQDTWLFKGTIEANLKYGIGEGKSVSMQTFLEATKATYVDHFVQSLPDGYQTVLDDEGAAISVGEKQLLTIARAFLADPDILILDEATSSVDTRTEVLVQKAMNALRSNRTSFVIAHRLSTIRDADVILVMEHGSIVEQGNHNDLIRKGGRYAALYQSQFEEDIDDTGNML